MTQITAFTPSILAPFRFQGTFDGQICNVTVKWSLFGARWYISVDALDGTNVIYRSLVGSPSPLQLASLSWDSERGLVLAATADPHGFTVGSMMSLTLSGNTPASYDGAFDCFVTGPTTFTYPMATDPGGSPASALGTADWHIDLVAGYFETSTLVFRTDSQQFEISP